MSGHLDTSPDARMSRAQRLSPARRAQEPATRLRAPYPGRLLGLVLWAVLVVVVAVDRTAGTWPHSILIILAVPVIALLLIGPRK